MNINIRLETPQDYYEVEALTREAFWKTIWGTGGQQICEEHLLVHRLRSSPSFVPELDYVAEANGKIVGHIIYAKSWVEDAKSCVYEMLTFGPLSVLPEYQGNGIGKALMLHTFLEAKLLGYRAVLIYGHPDYYPRVGFRRASEYGIISTDGKIRDSFMIYPLYEDALKGISGKFILDTVYEGLTQEDALEFDKRFPPKELHIPCSTDILLERLEADAQNAIIKLDCQTLALLSTKSEKELSLLPGIDAATIKTIIEVMEEQGIKWGASIA